MGLYQGRALKTEAPRRRVGRVGLVMRMLAVAGVAVALAHLPWDSMSGRLFRLTDLRVVGMRYLDARSVAAIAGVRQGQDLLALDPARVRQTLLLHPRIEAARVSRRWPNGLEIRVTERTPVMLVRHGLPWEVDSAGVLLEPLAAGVVADVPLLAGAGFDEQPAGTRLRVAPVLRGLAWVRAMSAREIQLGGQVSEIDVSDAATTGLLMMNGTRVLTPTWPPETRTLSALRVVLADLERSGSIAREVDLRYRNQVIVRPVEPDPHADPAITGRPRAGPVEGEPRIGARMESSLDGT